MVKYGGVCVCVIDGPILEYSLRALSLQLEEVWEPMSLYRCPLDTLSGVNSYIAGNGNHQLVAYPLYRSI